MTRAPLPSLANPHDFDLIEAAVKETERGRWFLDEYARRNRHAETERVLAAIARLEGAALRPDGLSSRLLDELAAIGKVLSELSSAGALTLTEAAALNAGSSDTMTAMGEQLQALGHALRPQGVKARECDLIERGASALFAAAARVDHAARREVLVHDILKAVEGNIGAVLERFGNGPAHAEPEAAGPQADEAPPAVEATVEPEAPAAPVEAPARPTPPVALPKPRLATPAESPFAAIDRLAAEERLRLFH